MGDTKQIKEFKDLLSKVNELIKNKRFDEAIKYYIKIHDSFEKLPLVRKDQVKKHVSLIYNELIVYMNVNEAYKIAKEGDIKILKNKLEHIYELSLDLWNVKDASELLKYVHNKYIYSLNVYVYKTSLKEFAEKYVEARTLINERKFDGAIKIYSELLVYYNNLLKYEKNDTIKLDLYNKMKELYLDLSCKKSLSDAYSKEKKEAKKVDKVKDEFSEIKKLIEQDNLDKASKLLR